MKCIPDGWCSDDYRIKIGDRNGYVGFSTKTPFGTINDGHKDYSIVLAGKIKRKWKLMDGDTVVCSATRKLGLKRVVKITKGGDVYTLSRKADSEAKILEGPSTSACYQHIHPFTKRQKITGQWSDDCLVIFGFWFVAYYEQIDTVIGEIVGSALASVTS